MLFLIVSLICFPNSLFSQKELSENTIKKDLVKQFNRFYKGASNKIKIDTNDVSMRDNLWRFNEDGEWIIGEPHTGFFSQTENLEALVLVNRASCDVVLFPEKSSLLLKYTFKNKCWKLSSINPFSCLIELAEFKSNRLTELLARTEVSHFGAFQWTYNVLSFENDSFHSLYKRSMFDDAMYYGYQMSISDFPLENQSVGDTVEHYYELAKAVSIVDSNVRIEKEHIDVLMEFSANRFVTMGRIRTNELVFKNDQYDYIKRGEFDWDLTKREYRILKDKYALGDTLNREFELSYEHSLSNDSSVVVEKEIIEIVNGFKDDEYDVISYQRFNRMKFTEGKWMYLDKGEFREVKQK